MFQTNNNTSYSDNIQPGTLPESSIPFNFVSTKHGYCQVHEEMMERIESDSQVTYKCRKCERSYIELKDTSRRQNKKRR